MRPDSSYLDKMADIENTTSSGSSEFSVRYVDPSNPKKAAETNLVILQKHIECEMTPNMLLNALSEILINTSEHEKYRDRSFGLNHMNEIIKFVAKDKEQRDQILYKILDRIGAQQVDWNGIESDPETNQKRYLIDHVDADNDDMITEHQNDERIEKLEVELVDENANEQKDDIDGVPKEVVTIGDFEHFLSDLDSDFDHDLDQKSDQNPKTESAVSSFSSEVDVLDHGHDPSQNAHGAQPQLERTLTDHFKRAQQLESMYQLQIRSKQDEWNAERESFKNEIKKLQDEASHLNLKLQEEREQRIQSDSEKVALESKLKELPRMTALELAEIERLQEAMDIEQDWKELDAEKKEMESELTEIKRLHHEKDIELKKERQQLMQVEMKNEALESELNNLKEKLKNLENAKIENESTMSASTQKEKKEQHKQMQSFRISVDIKDIDEKGEQGTISIHRGQRTVVLELKRVESMSGMTKMQCDEMSSRTKS